MYDLLTFVSSLLAALRNGSRDELIILEESAALGLIDGIRGVIVERTENNEAYIAAAPAVILYQLAKIFPH